MGDDIQAARDNLRKKNRNAQPTLECEFCRLSVIKRNGGLARHLQVCMKEYSEEDRDYTLWVAQRRNVLQGFMKTIPISMIEKFSESEHDQQVIVGFLHSVLKINVVPESNTVKHHHGASEHDIKQHLKLFEEAQRLLPDPANLKTKGDFSSASSKKEANKVDFQPWLSQCNDLMNKHELRQLLAPRGNLPAAHANDGHAAPPLPEMPERQLDPAQPEAAIIDQPPERQPELANPAQQMQPENDQPLNRPPQIAQLSQPQLPPNHQENLEVDHAMKPPTLSHAHVDDHPPPQPSFLSELQSPYMPTYGAVNAVPVDSHAPLASDQLYTMQAHSITNQVVAMGNTTATRPPASPQPRIVSITQINNNPFSPASATNAPHIHQASFPFITAPPPCDPPTTLASTGSLVVSAASSVTPPLIQDDIQANPSPYPSSESCNSENAPEADMCDAQRSDNDADDDDDDDCNATDEHPHWVKSNINMYTKGKKLHGSRKLFKKIRNSVPCFVSSCSYSKRKNAAVYLVEEHFAMHVNNNECSQADVDTFLENQQQQYGYDKGFWFAFFRHVNSRSSANSIEDMRNQANYLARYLHFVESSLEASKGVPIGFEKGIDIKVVWENPRFIYEICQEHTQHGSSPKNFVKAIRSFADMVCRKFEMYFPEMSSGDSFLAMQRFTNEVSAALKVKDRSWRQTKIIDANQRMTQNNTEENMQHLLFQTESPVTIDTWNEAFARVFESDRVIETNKKGIIRDMVILRGLLVAIICLGHAKRVGVFQNLRVWEFRNAKKRGSVKQGFSYLINVSMHKTGDKGADGINLREREYQLFEKFYQATEDHPFFNRKREVLTKMDEDVVDNLRKTDEFWGSMSRGQVVDGMKHFFFQPTDGACCSKPSQILSEWQKAMTKMTGYEYRHMTADDARETFTVHAKGVDNLYADELDGQEKPKDLEKNMADYQSHSEKTANLWYSASGWGSSADKQLGSLNYIRELCLKKTKGGALIGKKIHKPSVPSNSKYKVIGETDSSVRSGTAGLLSVAGVTTTEVDSDFEPPNAQPPIDAQPKLGTPQLDECVEVERAPTSTQSVKTSSTKPRVKAKSRSIRRELAEIREMPCVDGPAKRANIPSPVPDDIQQKASSKREAAMEEAKRLYAPAQRSDASSCSSPDIPREIEQAIENEYLRDIGFNIRRKTHQTFDDDSPPSEKSSKLPELELSQLPPAKFRRVESKDDSLVAHLPPSDDSDDEHEDESARDTSPPPPVDNAIKLLREKKKKKRTSFRSPAVTRRTAPPSRLLFYNDVRKLRSHAVERLQMYAEAQSWPNVLVKECKEGKGLYASELIHQGVVVCNYGGTILPESEWKNTTGTSSYSCKYVKDGVSMIVDCANNPNILARYANYSQKCANMVLKPVDIGEDKVLVLVTNTSVCAGEQLLWDYGERTPSADVAKCVSDCLRCRKKTKKKRKKSKSSGK